jgi:transposase
MKIVDEILRLESLKFTKRQISRTLGIHRNTITKYLEQHARAQLSEAAHPGPLNLMAAPPAIPTWVDGVDWQGIRDEILKAVPIQIVYEELFDQGKVPVTYPAFWKQLQKRAPLLKTTMVRIFEPGSKIEIDYADGIDIVNVQTGEATRTELFVGVLAHSRYTYAEFTISQKSEDFLSSHVRMLNFFGGSAQTVSPDNLKSAVTKAHRYDPVLNPAYTRLASHYSFAVVPARVRRPQDKAIVERTIQIFQRWFFMKVRNRTFTSLVELNRVLGEYVTAFNLKIHRTFNRTRKAMFEESEKAALIPLPKDPYLVQTFSRAKLSRDCHLAFDHNFYSSPHTLRGLDLDIWATDKTVEIYHDGDRVAMHTRYRSRGKFATDVKHYPPSHQAYLEEEDIAKLKSSVMSIGQETSRLINELLSGEFPLRHLRRAQAILALAKKYSKSDLEFAASMANRFNNKNLQYIERVIVKTRGPAGAATARKRNGGDPITRDMNPNLRGLDEILH